MKKLELIVFLFPLILVGVLLYFVTVEAVSDWKTGNNYMYPPIYKKEK